VGYLKNDEDAEKTKKMVEKEGRKCITVKGDIGQKKFCEEFVQKTVDTFHRLDILVNNAAVHFVKHSLEEISEEQLETTFRTNIFSYFFMSQAALPHLKKCKEASIINTSSVVAFKGKDILLDYTATKGAIVAFTRGLSQNLAETKIRVNAVAPGPIWTPLIVSSFDAEHVKNFGKNSALGRPGQPEEVASAYVYLACKDSSYVTGEVMHVNGGTPV